MVTEEEGTNEVIQERLKTAKVIFSTTAIDIIKLPQETKRKAKTRVFETNVKYMLLYRCETRESTKTLNELQVFVNKFLKIILGVFWPDRISNKDNSEKNRLNRDFGSK